MTQNNKPSWDWPHPQSWPEVYPVIASLLLGFLALNYLIDFLKEALP